MTVQIALRADASADIGNGHIVRCLSLAIALRSAGANCTFLCANPPEGVRAMLTGQNFAVLALPAYRDSIADSGATLSALRSAGVAPGWLIVDHYGLDRSWEERVRPAVGAILAVDDLANRAHAADVLLDQNLQDDEHRYDRWLRPSCRRLLGPRFALLRPEFAAARAARTAHGQALLACVGGSDPTDILSKIVSAWSRLEEPRRHLHLAVGSDSPNVPQLRRTCESTPGVTLHAPAANMAGLMASSQLLLGTTGSISWERCSVGLPAIMGTTADNQKSNLRQLCRRRTGLSIGDWNEVSVERLSDILLELLRRPKLLDNMGRRAGDLVDGRGAERVAVALLGDQLTLRRAVAGDAEMAWRWRNDATTRANSLDPSPVPLDGHLTWWNDSLANQQRDLLVAMIGQLPVGVLRLDQSPQGAIVSIYLDPQLTGLGLGRLVLQAGQGWIVRHRAGTGCLIAHILPANRASIAIFTAAGFAPRDDRWVWQLPVGVSVS